MRALALIALAACSWVSDAGTLPNAPARRAMPVTVAYAGEHHDAAIASAVQWWNDELELEALVFVDGPLDVDVLVVDAPSYAEKGDGSADPRAGIVFLHRPGDAYRAWLIVCHELGHAAFWLDHDTDHGTSIMAETITDFEPWAPSWRRYAVTDGDRARALAMLGVP